MKNFFTTLIILCSVFQLPAQDFINAPKPWYPEYNISLKKVGFTHPCTVVNKEGRAIVLQKIQQKKEPQYSAYLNLLEIAEQHLSFDPEAPAEMNIMGGYEQNSNLSEMRAILWKNSNAAYSCALAYSYSGSKKYAVKATEILMVWANKATVFTGTDRGLQLGSFFNPMLYAADLLQDFNEWENTDRLKFETWWRENCLNKGDILNVMRHKDNNWKDAAILGVISAAVVFEDTLLLKEALIQQTSYFYNRTDQNVKNKGAAWKFSKEGNSEFLLREVERNNGRSGLTYTAYALTTMVQHFEIAGYFGFDFWNKQAENGASIKGIIQQYYKWDILNEKFAWNKQPKKTTERRNIYELANNYFNMGNEFKVWLQNNRPVTGSQGDTFSTLNKGE